MSETTLVPGMSPLVTMTNSSQGTPGSNAMLWMQPRGIVLRMVAPCSMPGGCRSSTYWAAPVSLPKTSLRWTGWPTTRLSMLYFTWVLLYPSYGAANEGRFDVALQRFAKVGCAGMAERKTFGRDFELSAGIENNQVGIEAQCEAALALFHPGELGGCFGHPTHAVGDGE